MEDAEQASEISRRHPRDNIWGVAFIYTCLVQLSPLVDYEVERHFEYVLRRRLTFPRLVLFVRSVCAKMHNTDEKGGFAR